MLLLSLSDFIYLYSANHSLNCSCCCSLKHCVSSLFLIGNHFGSPFSVSLVKTKAKNIHSICKKYHSWLIRLPVGDVSSYVRSRNPPLMTGEQLSKQFRYSAHDQLRNIHPWVSAGLLGTGKDCERCLAWPAQIGGRAWGCPSYRLCGGALSWGAGKPIFYDTSGNRFKSRWRASKRLGTCWRRWREMEMESGCMSLTKSFWKPRLEPGKWMKWLKSCIITFLSPA